MIAVVAPAGIAIPFGLHPAAPVALFPGVDSEGSGDGGEVDEPADGVAEPVEDAPFVGAQPARAMPTASVSTKNTDFDKGNTDSSERCAPTTRRLYGMKSSPGQSC